MIQEKEVGGKWKRVRKKKRGEERRIKGRGGKKRGRRSGKEETEGRRI